MVYCRFLLKIANFSKFEGFSLRSLFAINIITKGWKVTKEGTLTSAEVLPDIFFYQINSTQVMCYNYVLLLSLTPCFDYDSNR